MDSDIGRKVLNILGDHEALEKLSGLRSENDRLRAQLQDARMVELSVEDYDNMGRRRVVADIDLALGWFGSPRSHQDHDIGPLWFLDGFSFVASNQTCTRNKNTTNSATSTWPPRSLPSSFVTKSASSPFLDPKVNPSCRKSSHDDSLLFVPGSKSFPLGALDTLQVFVGSNYVPLDIEHGLILHSSRGTARTTTTTFPGLVPITSVISSTAAPGQVTVFQIQTKLGYLLGIGVLDLSPHLALPALEDEGHPPRTVEDLLQDLSGNTNDLSKPAFVMGLAIPSGHISGIISRSADDIFQVAGFVAQVLNDLLPITPPFSTTASTSSTSMASLEDPVEEEEEYLVWRGNPEMIPALLWAVGVRSLEDPRWKVVLRYMSSPHGPKGWNKIYRLIEEATYCLEKYPWNDCDNNVEFLSTTKDE